MAVVFRGCALADRTDEDVVHRRQALGEVQYLDLRGQGGEQFGVGQSPAFAHRQARAGGRLVSGEHVAGRTTGQAAARGGEDIERAVAEAGTDGVDLAVEHHFRMVDQGDAVTDLLDRGHVVRRKEDGVPLVAQFEYLAFEQFGIDGIETAERFVEDEQLGLVDDGDDELHLLLHALGELFELLAPPRHDPELLEPRLDAAFGFAVAEPFELGQVDGLLADLHLLIKAALFGQVADVVDVFGARGVAVEAHLARVGRRDAVDDADEGRLAGPVGTEQAEDLPAGHLDAHLVEGEMVGVALHHVVSFKEKVFHTYYIYV